MHLAHVHSDLVVFAITMTVTKETDLVGAGRDALDLDAKFVLAALLFILLLNKCCNIQTFFYSMACYHHLQSLHYFFMRLDDDKAKREGQN